MFNFQSVVVGPSYNFKDYIDFIDGNSILKHQVNNKKKIFLGIDFRSIFMSHRNWTTKKKN